MDARRSLLALLACLVLALAAGCGGDDEGGGDGDGAGSDTGGAATQASGAQQTFATTCGGCHTLKDAGTNGQVGPNLDQLKPSKEQVLTAIAQGPSVMPAELLKGAEADEVAQYVADAAGG